ncbi:hypothetical protein K466DRAFT_406156 [Polyporus arcularius HHB13444]|uniref:Uncharacterized protein n=1 Tax=Polyporus arcularius HHB13444 TaxID=1314778 RepID=A0A5C3NRC5_9APHY|nr:hypothetical protein K466DRAFT_406156 [Polyporus arcularius HHB13444]
MCAELYTTILPQTYGPVCRCIGQGYGVLHKSCITCVLLGAALQSALTLTRAFVLYICWCRSSVPSPQWTVSRRAGQGRILYVSCAHVDKLRYLDELRTYATETGPEEVCDCNTRRHDCARSPFSSLLHNLFCKKRSLVLPGVLTPAGGYVRMRRAYAREIGE